METIQELEQELISEFEVFDDWMDKYEYIIDLGKELENYPEADRTDDRLIKGCQSRVWLTYKKEADKLAFYADSDAIITKGIIALLIRVLNHQSAQEIAKADFDFINTIGLTEHLSPTRSNGLVSMVKQIKMIAIKES